MWHPSEIKETRHWCAGTSRYRILSIPQGQPGLGSPAHAEIDRTKRWPEVATRGFPRTRVDRPLALAGTPGLVLVPPHTRG